MKIKNKAILIVDDEPDILWAMEHLLKRRGLVLIRALNGLETIIKLEERRFELVLLDAKLPDIEGLALANKIKGVDPSVPIVLISGYLNRDDKIVQHALSAGLIVEYIAKPFQHADLLNAVEKFCFR